MWCAGPEIFISGPIEDNIRTFAFLKNDKFTWVGLPHSGQHMATCCLCSSLQPSFNKENSQQPVNLLSNSQSEVKIKNRKIAPKLQ